MHDPWYTTKIDFFSMKLLCLLAVVCACSEQRSKVLELLNFCVSSLIFIHSIFIIILKDISIQFMNCHVLTRVFGNQLFVPRFVKIEVPCLLSTEVSLRF